MKPIYQRSGAAMGETGDCFAACIASLLELRLEEVPNFMASTPDGVTLDPAAARDLDEWFIARGFHYVEFGFRATLEQTLAMMETEHHGMTYVLVGCTYGYRTHAVVARGDRIVHDPATNAGQSVLTRACRDGFTRVGFIVVNL